MFWFWNECLSQTWFGDRVLSPLLFGLLMALRARRRR